MVPLFVGYALVIWYLAAVHRRRAIGVLAVLGGLAGLVLLNWVHIKMGEWSDGEMFVPVLQTITYPYSALVVAVGVFIVCIPRETELRCRGCRYSLSGLLAIEGVIVCPECGVKNQTRAAYRRSGADRESFRGDDSRENIRTGPGGFRRHSGPADRSAADRAPEPAGREDQQGHAADQPPAEQAEHAR